MPAPSAWALKSRSWSPVGTVQDRSTLPLRSVLGVCHWQTAPEAAAETGALRRRGLRGAANWKARALAGWRQVKVSSTFSKGRYVPVGRCPAADRGGSREAGCGTASHGPKGVARTVGPAFPYFPKRGDGRPPLGTAQKPLPQGLREGNERVCKKTSVYAALQTCSDERG